MIQPNTVSQSSSIALRRYWAHLNNQVQGPYEPMELIAVPGFSSDTRICLEGKQTWISASEDQEITCLMVAPGMKECPFCAELIKLQAVKCKHCGSMVLRVKVQTEYSAMATMPSSPESTAREAPALRNTVATILFADFSDYTKMAGGVEPEELHEIMSSFFEDLDGAVLAYGGQVDKHIGDCVMALFGAEEAQDDHAQRALWCAVEMLRRVARRAEALGKSLPLHIGINSGEIAYAAVGNDDKPTVTGDAVNVASRLADAAPAGKIWCGTATWRRLKGKARGELVTVAVKGKDGLQEYYEYSGLAEEEETASRLGGIPFIGRKQELDTFFTTLEAFRIGTPSSPPGILIAGRSGTGKSRLFLKALSMVDQNQFLTLFAQGMPFGERPLFDTLVTLIGHIFPPGGTIEERIDAGWQMMGERFSHYREDLLTLFDAGGQEDPDGDEPDTQERFMSSIAAFLLEYSELRPLILAVDDLQWADAATLGFLKKLAEQARNQGRVFLAATARDEGGVEHFFAPESIRVVHMSALGREDTRQFIADALSMDPVPEKMLNALHKRTSGIILYLVQVLEALAEYGALIREERGWRFTENAVDIPIPEGLADLIRVRIDRLPTFERQVLLAAAGIGPRFPKALLFELHGDAGESLNEALQALQTRGFLGVFEDLEIYFIHGSVCETAARLLRKAERRRIAEKVVALWDSDMIRTSEIRSILPKHLRFSGRTDLKIGFLIEEAERAARQHRFDEAGLLAREADNHPWPSNLSERLRSRLYSILTKLANKGGESRQAAQYADVALQIARERGDTREIGVVLQFRAKAAEMEKQFDAARDFYLQAIEFHRQAANATGMIICLNYLGKMALHAGDLDAAHSYFKQALTAAIPAQDAKGLDFTRQNLARLAEKRNDLETAMRLFKESLGYNRQTGNAIGTKIVCHALSRIAQAAGDQLRGQEYAKLAAQYGQATGTARERFFNAFQQAKVLHQQGRTAEARTILEEPLRMAEANKMPELGLALGLLGQIEEAEGRFDAARMAYERALELDDAGGSRPRAINLYRLARLAHRQNDFQNAEGLYLDSYSEAEQANDALGMKSALHGIGRLCEQNERPSEARTYYERQLKLLMMDPHGSEIYIMKAREAIIRLGGDPGPEPHFASYGAAKNRSNKSFSEEPGIKIMPDTMQVPDKWLLLVRGDAAFFRELEIAAQGAVRRLTSEFPSKFADYEKGIYIMAPDEDLLDWIASFARARGMQVSYQRRSARRSDH